MGLIPFADILPVDSSYLQYGALGVLAILLILLFWIGNRLISSAETQRKSDLELKEKELDIQEKRFDKIVNAIDRQTGVFVAHFEALRQSVANACNYDRYTAPNGQHNSPSTSQPAPSVSEK